MKTYGGYRSEFELNIARKLKDEKFYKLCSETTLKRYENYYTEEVFVKHWNGIWS